MGWPQPMASQKRRQNHGDQRGGAGPTRHWHRSSFHTWCKSLIMCAKKGNGHGNARIEVVICGFPQWPDNKMVNVRNLKIQTQGKMMSVPVFLDSLIGPIVLFFVSIKAEWCSRENGDHFEWEMCKNIVSSKATRVTVCKVPLVTRDLLHEETVPLGPHRVCSVAQSCLTLCNPVDCSPPGSSVHGILQARILECVAITYSRGSSWPRDQTWVSRVSWISKQILYH